MHDVHSSFSLLLCQSSSYFAASIVHTALCLLSCTLVLLSLQEVDPTPDTEDLESLEEGAGSFLTDLAGSIPGIDEAMSFAEVMRQVNKLDVAAACYASSR